jgi:hypothetical protein
MKAMLISARHAKTGAFLVVLAGSLSTCSTDQPKTLCATAHGGFSVRYSLVQGTGPCAELKGGVMGVQSYVEGGPGKVPAFAKPPVAIKPAEIGDLIDRYAPENLTASQQTSLGMFADDKPEADGFCKVGSMSPVALSLPAVPPKADGMGGMTEALPAVDVRYELSNVRFYVSASVIGTVLSADLKYTLNNCTATYKVSGIYPTVGCEKTISVTGPDGMPMDKGTGEPVQDLCNSCPDPANGRVSGSGIGPDLDIECDRDSLLCLPKAEAPSLRATPLICQ